MSPQPITTSTLFYGDNLPILREHIPDETVDLIYLDPPFNSNRSYNVLFKDESGHEAESQITAFEDSWHWNPAAERIYEDLVAGAPLHVATMIDALHQFIGNNQMMAYLAMMAARLVELHRVLKPTGSLYLHCDPTASHYLKIILDAIFDPRNFRNQLIWERAAPKSHAFTRYASAHDTVLFYSKGGEPTWNAQYVSHRVEYLKSHYGNVEPGTGRRYTLGDLLNPNKDRPHLTYEFPPGSGNVRVWRWTQGRMMQAWKEGRVVIPKEGGVPRYKRYLDEMHGTPITDVWTDIPPINSQAAERLGYPTQKPLALLERIISASSNPGDLVLDPFGGCGTAIIAAQELGRRWIGIDITHLAIALVKNRLKDSFGLAPNVDYKVIGEPTDTGGARQLAREDRYQFQWWAGSLIQARPYGAQSDSKKGKKGSDTGIDGLLLFSDDNTGKLKRVLVQVKSGHVNAGQIRDLRGTVERENASIGVFITLEEPTGPMNKEAVSSGYYHSSGWDRDYPKIQILTVEELLHGKKVEMPPSHATFKKAKKVSEDAKVQTELDL